MLVAEPLAHLGLEASGIGAGIIQTGHVRRGGRIVVDADGQNVERAAAVEGTLCASTARTS
jgi:hypothetical protein